MERGHADPASATRPRCELVNPLTEEPVAVCTHCQTRPIPSRNRVYCVDCSRQASRIWKARERRRWAAAWRAKGRSGPPPYLDGWSSRDAYRAYYRKYMRRWRRRRASKHSREGE